MIAVAVDGPAGAGKSTLARALAGRLNMLYVDTGALYRTIGLYVLKKEKDPKNPVQVAACLTELTVNLTHQDGEQQVWLNGRDVSGEIRTQEVSAAASAVSAHKEVRDFLFDLQRNLALAQPVVMDGRDIGTVVLPEAKVKIFLTASAEERAKRRVAQLTEKGVAADYATVLREVNERDEADSHRAIAPLKRAADAVLFDTTGETQEQSLNRLEQTVRGLLA